MNRYAIGLGANRARPERTIRAALAALSASGVVILATAPVVATDPVGPGRRRYANGAALVETPLAPPALLALAKRIERRLGRRPGRRWGDRAIDIDLLLWSGGRWRQRRLVIPHPRLAERRFALDPLVRLAPGWPIGHGLTVRHAHSRLTAARPLHRGRRAGWSP